MTLSNRLTASLFLIAGLCALGSAEAQTPDRDRLWTTVGSAGTLDEADTGKVFFERAKVQMGQPIGGVSTSTGTASKTTTAAGTGIIQTRTAVIRYNVTPVDGMFPPPVALPPTIGTQFRVRFLDTGASARVVARLVEVDLLNGSEATRMTFDSNAFAAGNGYQVQQVGECNRRFDFVRKAYYIEATLSLSGNLIVVGNAAGIEIIKLGNTPCRG
jgi:hypothetical protein